MNAIPAQSLKGQPYGTCAAVVAAITAQRNVELRLLTSQGWNVVGNVSIPHAHALPGVGAVVEVQRLPTSPGTKELHSPHYLRPRADIAPYQCIMAQLTHRISWKAL